MFVTSKDSEGQAPMAIAREATPLSCCLGVDGCGNYLALLCSQEVCEHRTYHYLLMWTSARDGVANGSVDIDQKMLCFRKVKTPKQGKREC